MSATTTAPVKEKSPYSHEVTLPSGKVVKVTLRHEDITVTRRLNARSRALVQKLIDHEIAKVPPDKEQEIANRFYQVASTYTFPGTSLSLTIGEPTKEGEHRKTTGGTIRGFSVCKPPDNFCREEGIKHALKNTLAKCEDWCEPADVFLFSKADRKALLAAISRPSLREIIGQSTNLAEARANSKKKTGKVSARRVLHTGRLAKPATKGAKAKTLTK